MGFRNAGPIGVENKMNEQLSLMDWQPLGTTIVPERDNKRLSRQMEKVYRAMSDGEWWTLGRLSFDTGAPEASASARIRDLRRLGYTIERRFVERGLWAYRMIKP